MINFLMPQKKYKRVMFFTIGLFFLTACINNEQYIELSADTHVKSLNPNENHSDFHTIYIFSWTRNGIPYNSRAYLNFPINNIEKAREIASIELQTSFYKEPNIKMDKYVGENDMVISIIKEEWEPSTLNWNNTPKLHKDFTYQIKGPGELDSNFTFDLFPIYEYVIHNNIPFHGIQIRMQEEQPYKMFYFASTEFNKHPSPKVKVTYY